MALFNIVAVVTLFVLASAETTDENRKLTQLYKGTKNTPFSIQLGPRPYYLVQSMASSILKDKLTQCANTMKKFKKSTLTVSHRGAPLMVRYCFTKHVVCGK